MFDRKRVKDTAFMLYWLLKCKDWNAASNGA